MPFNLGLGLGIQRGGYMFSPASLFTASEPGVIYDASDINTLFQDTAGTQPVTAVGQAVALVLDKSGRGNHATQSILASRPLYALHPSSGIRNVAPGSADVGNATYWPASTTSGGITATKVASGIDTDGLPYVDYRYQGTAAGTQHTTTYAASLSRTAASLGQTYSCSAVFRLIGGSLSNVTGIGTQVAGEIAPSTFNEFANSPFATSTSDTTVTATRTLATAGTNQVRLAIILQFTNGATIDVTYRIKALQLELGSTRTAYQFNYANFNIVEAPFAQVGNLLFDGIDDFLVTPTITPNTDKVQVFAGVRKQSDAARGVVVELGIGGVSSAFLIDAPGPNPATQRYRFASVGAIVSVAETALGPSPDTAVITGLGDIPGDSAILRRNGVQVGQSTVDQGAGNFANDIVYIGRRGGTSLPFNGRLYGLVVRFGPNLDAATIAATEAWMNTRTGAY